MQICKFGMTSFLAALLFVFVGCGKETVSTTSPLITSTTPTNGDTGVPISQVLTATFSEALNPATINASTFKLAGPGGAAVTGTVTYTATGSVASFTPSVSLSYNTLYTATVTTAVMDTIGNEPANNYVWSFTTATQPTLLSTVPANGATAIPINQVLSATFSKAMNCSTLGSPAATFQLAGPGANAVTGTVTCAGAVASFTPSSVLAYNTLYTATITTGATDTTGDPLAGNYVWTFTTAIQPAVTSTTPANGATGVSPNQVLNVTFSKPMNCATLTSPATNFTVKGPGVTTVAGTVGCAGTVATFTPAATLATNTLFTAGITTGATDTSGNPLVANYGWTFKTAAAVAPLAVISTTPVNGATGVPITQAVTATFNNALNPSTINATTFTVKAPGGVTVTGAVTYVASGSVAIFTPAANLAASTLYTATITTGATDLANSTLSANYSWTFTTAVAPDTTKPTVVSTIPTSGSIAVPLNRIISATFSKAMNATTINATTFLLTGPGATPVAGQVAYASVGTTATFTPTVNLLPSVLYTATITTGASDLSGNTLAVNYVWTFTTGTLPDTTPPQVVSTIPVNSAVNVPTNQAISATFTEAMNPLTITTATFMVTGPGSAQVAGTVSYDPINFIATFSPSALLSGSYIAFITSGATDLAGNPLGTSGAPNPWNFTTGAVVVPPPVNLGTAALFGGVGGTAGITNMGVFTVVNGNIGTTGVSTLVTGFHDNGPNCIYTETPLNIGLVNGSIDTAPPPPTVGCPTEGTAITSAIAAQAAVDTLTAYNALVAIPGGMDVSVCPGCGGGSAGELGNRTLSPGIYKSAPGSYAITLGDLTLDAHGDANAFWVFQAAATLTVGTPASHRNVLLVNGAQAKNVFWQVGTAATINGILGGGTMTGTVIAQAGISVSTAGVVAITTVNGRLLVTTGPLTVVNAVINVPAP